MNLNSALCEGAREAIEGPRGDDCPGGSAWSQVLDRDDPGVGVGKGWVGCGCSIDVIHGAIGRD